jgi:hypothetical protein
MGVPRELRIHIPQSSAVKAVAYTVAVTGVPAVYDEGVADHELAPRLQSQRTAAAISSGERTRDLFCAACPLPPRFVEGS